MFVKTRDLDLLGVVQPAVEDGGPRFSLRITMLTSTVSQVVG